MVFLLSFTLLLRAGVLPEFILFTFLKGSSPPQKQKATVAIIDPLCRTIVFGVLSSVCRLNSCTSCQRRNQFLQSKFSVNLRHLINPLNPELNPICYFLALLAHHFLHVSRIRVKSLTLRLQMSYIYIYIYIWSTYS